MPGHEKPCEGSCGDIGEVGVGGKDFYTESSLVNTSSVEMLFWGTRRPI